MSIREVRVNKARHWWAGVLVVFLIAVLLTHGIDSMHMRPDEELTFRNTSSSLEVSFHDLAYQNNHPPLWYTSVWFWNRLVGDSEFAGRMSGVLLSMLTLTLVYQFARRQFGSSRFGIYAMAVLGTSVLFFIYNLEMRPYALTMLSGTVSMWFLTQWLAKRTRRSAVLYGLSVAAMLYVHYYLFFLVLCQMIYFVFRLPGLRLLRQSLLAVVSAIVVYLPWTPFVFTQMAHLERVSSWGGHTLVEGLLIPTSPTNQRTIDNLLQIATTANGVLYGIVLIIGMALLWRKSGYWLALLWGIGLPAVVLFVNMYSKLFTERYVSYLIVGLAIAVGAALAALPTRLRPVALIGLVLVNLWQLPALIPQRTPYRDIFQKVAAVAKSGDAIYFLEGIPQEGYLQWQMDHYLPNVLQETMIADLDQAVSTRRVWFTTSEWFDPQVQETFQLLTETHPLQHLVGDCNSKWCYLTLLLEGTPFREPILFGEDMPFWGADVAIVNPAKEVAVRLWWLVEQTPAADYSIGLYLLDSTGTVIAQTDGPINSQYGGTIPIQEMLPDVIYIDVRNLPLPEDIPAGDYQLYLAVYQWWDDERLTLRDGSDMLLLDTVSIP